MTNLKDVWLTNEWGLAWYRGRLYYSLNAGWFHNWPEWWLDLIVKLYAPVSCFMLGHEYMDWTVVEDEIASDPYCLHCDHHDPKMQAGESEG